MANIITRPTAKTQPQLNRLTQAMLQSMPDGMPKGAAQITTLFNGGDNGNARKGGGASGSVRELFLYNRPPLQSEIDNLPIPCFIIRTDLTMPSPDGAEIFNAAIYARISDGSVIPIGFGTLPIAEMNYTPGTRQLTITTGDGASVSALLTQADDANDGLMTSADVQTLRGLVSDVGSLKAGGVWRATFAAYADMITAFPGLDVSATDWFVNDFVEVEADESPATSTHTQGNPSVYTVTVDSTGTVKTLAFRRDDKNAPIAVATNDSPGVVKGSTAAGKVYAETDGSMSLIGYDALVQSDENNAQNAAANALAIENEATARAAAVQANAAAITAEADRAQAAEAAKLDVVSNGYARTINSVPLDVYRNPSIRYAYSGAVIIQASDTIAQDSPTGSPINGLVMYIPWRDNNGYGMQLVFQLEVNRMYSRIARTTNWSAWNRFANKNEDPLQIGGDTAQAVRINSLGQMQRGSGGSYGALGALVTDATGTWVPKFAGTGTGYTSSGAWIKHGRIVYATGKITLTSKANVNPTQLLGIPFPTFSNRLLAGNVYIRVVDLPDAFRGWALLGQISFIRVDMFVDDAANSSTVLSAAALYDNSTVDFMLIYETNS